MKSVTAVLLVWVLSGCASSINEHNANTYARSASLASKQGDWEAARKMWARAVVNASLAHADKRYLAVLNYEYARALGVTCFYDEARQYFEAAYALDRETGGPTFMSLAELGRMQLARGDNEKASVYMARAYEEGQTAQLEKHDPVGLADLIDDHARALEAQGNMGGAQEKRRFASMLRAANPGARTKTDITPYGTHCASRKG